MGLGGIAITNQVYAQANSVRNTDVRKSDSEKFDNANMNTHNITGKNGLSERMLLASRHADMKPAHIAKSLKKSRSTVQRWFDGTAEKIDALTCDRVATLLGVNSTWLATGRGQMLSISTGMQSQPQTTDQPLCVDLNKYQHKIDKNQVHHFDGETPLALAGTRPVGLTQRVIAVLNWTDATNWQDAVRLTTRTTSGLAEWPDDCFALEVKDEIVSGGSLPQGSLVIVSPSVKPAHGNRVLVLHHGKGIAVVYKYIDLGERPELHPVSEKLDKCPLLETDQIIGVVIKAIISYD